MQRVRFSCAEIRREVVQNAITSPYFGICDCHIVPSYPPIVTLTLFPQTVADAPIADTFRNAVDEFNHAKTLLAKYNATGEWTCMPVANELRYSGQHLCRSLRLMAEEQCEEQSVELLRADGHCRNAVHDSNDYLILFFSGEIRRAIRDVFSRIAQCPLCRSVPQGGNEYVEEIRKLQWEFLEICRRIAELHRKDPDFHTTRKILIGELEKIYLDVMSIFPSNRCDSVSPTVKPILVDTQYDGTFDKKSIVEMFNETEKHLKMLELIQGSMDSPFIHRVSEATRRLVMGKDESQCTETFLKECCSVHMEILYRMLCVVAKETGSKEVPVVWYERVLRDKWAYSDMKDEILKDIEKCIEGHYRK